MGRAGGQAHLSRHLSALSSLPIHPSTCRGRSLRLTRLGITEAMTPRSHGPQGTAEASRLTQFPPEAVGGNLSQ